VIDALTIKSKAKAAALVSRPFVLLLALLAVDQFVLVDDPGERSVVSWLGIAAQAIPLAALLFSPLSLSSRFARLLLAPMAVWLTLHGALQLYMRAAFGMYLDGDWLGIIRASSPEEIRWFFDNFGVIGLLGLLATLVAACFFGWVIWKSDFKSRVFGWVALGTFLGYVLLTGGVGAAAERIGAIGFVTDSVRCARLYGELEEMAKVPRFERPPVLDARARDVAGVFVLGESSARSHWSLYGYARPTTTPLDALGGELIVFSNVTAVASETSSALRQMFVGNGHTLAQATAAAGVRTALFSNQERWGQWGGVESYVFAGARQVYLQEEKLQKPYYDDALLPYLKRELAEAKGAASLTFLHLVGSHCPPSRYYPPSAAIFPPEPLPGAFGRWRLKDQLNHYDNTIHFTAKTVAEAIAALKRRGGAAFLVFVSDHGESPESDRWRDVKSRNVWEVPAVMWFSREYAERFPEQVRHLQSHSTQPLSTAAFTQMVPMFFALTISTPHRE